MTFTPEVREWMRWAVSRDDCDSVDVEHRHLRAALSHIDALEAERDRIECRSADRARLITALEARVAVLAAALRSILHPECDVETCGVSPCEACDRDRASWAKAHAALNDAAGALEGGKP